MASDQGVSGAIAADSGTVATRQSPSLASRLGAEARVSTIARHPSLKITDEQETNLRKLAAYLLTLPADYPKFAMSLFTQDGRGGQGHPAHLPDCGTAACAAGHGPSAGIRPKKGETWAQYSGRAFCETWSIEWDWCFAPFWARADNTAHGAARRILHMLERGVPRNAASQARGKAPLSYANGSPQ